MTNRDRDARETDRAAERPFPTPHSPFPALRALATTRWRIAIALTAAMVLNYFGFIALVAFRKPLMGSLITRGLSLGILLGALVIVVSWLLTWYYVWWANTRYDAEVKRLGMGGGRPKAGGWE